jgi:N-acetylmuramoyl-L-alanine amidase
LPDSPFAVLNSNKVAVLVEIGNINKEKAVLSKPTEIAAALKNAISSYYEN